MSKKKMVLVGILVVFCVAGQWLLRVDQAAAESPENQKIKSPETSESLFLTETESEGNRSAETQDSDSLHQQLVRQLITMIVFVALIGFVVWWFAKKYSRGIMGGKGKQVTVAETVALGPRKMVHILHVGSKKLLLGSTADSIRFLADITDALADLPQTDRVENGGAE